MLKLRSILPKTFCKTNLSSAIFDRDVKCVQRNRSANSPQFLDYLYVRDEMALRLTDRLLDIKRDFDIGLDLGCGSGSIYRSGIETIHCLIQTDLSSLSVEKSATQIHSRLLQSVVADEAHGGFPLFKPSSFDVVISCLSLHWINDLPTALVNVMKILRSDGAFIGCMFGGDTLHELRGSLQLAEQEREGGFGLHMSPLVQSSDVGSLLHQAGFKMLTVDVDEIVVNYPSIDAIMKDLQGMAENNCSLKHRKNLRRNTILAAEAIYRQLYGVEHPQSADLALPVTYQAIFFIGWKPSPQQPKPAKRGSGTHSFKDISN